MIGTEQAYFGYEKRLEEKLADTFNFIDHGNAKAEIERLRSLNAELVAALEYYASGIVGRGDIARAALAKVKEGK